MEGFKRGARNIRPVRRPVPEVPGPWFEATYPGECSNCLGQIEPGDTIRADGAGGWEHEECRTQWPPSRPRRDDDDGFERYGVSGYEL